MATGALIGVTAVSTGVQIYGQRKASRAKERAARSEAESKRQQALDLIERFEINTDVLRRRGKQFKGEQIAAFVSGGVEISSGSPLLAMEQTNRNIARSIQLDRMELDAQVDAIRRGADLDDVIAKDIAGSRGLDSFSLFMSGAARGASGVRGLQ